MQVGWEGSCTLKNLQRCLLQHCASQNTADASFLSCHSHPPERGSCRGVGSTTFKPLCTYVIGFFCPAGTGHLWPRLTSNAKRPRQRAHQSYEKEESVLYAPCASCIFLVTIATVQLRPTTKNWHMAEGSCLFGTRFPELAGIAVPFGCLGGKIGRRFLVYLVVFHHLPGKPIHFPPKGHPCLPFPNPMLTISQPPFPPSTPTLRPTPPPRRSCLSAAEDEPAREPREIHADFASNGFLFLAPPWLGGFKEGRQ